MKGTSLLHQKKEAFLVLGGKTCGSCPGNIHIRLLLCDLCWAAFEDCSEGNAGAGMLTRGF